MDIYFNNKYDKILSLGANCSVKFFIKRCLNPPYGETELFDYIGSSMRQINELILNDFEDLTTAKYFKSLIIIRSQSPIITNTKYHMRFLHDLKKPEDASSPVFKDKIQRRILRLKSYIVNSKDILFIRQQESNINRIPYILNLRSELEELRDFIDIIKMKYGCIRLTVIYINLEYDGWNKEHDIFSIKSPCLYNDLKTIHIHMQSLFEEKQVMEFI